MLNLLFVFLRRGKGAIDRFRLGEGSGWANGACRLCACRGAFLDGSLSKSTPPRQTHYARHKIRTMAVQWSDTGPASHCMALERELLLMIFPLSISGLGCLHSLPLSHSLIHHHSGEETQHPLGLDSNAHGTRTSNGSVLHLVYPKAIFSCVDTLGLMLTNDNNSSQHSLH
jgi:hypothetical protein